MTRAQIQPFIDGKYISIQKHPTEDLYIFNYTEKAQYEHNWTDETRQCRGLIMDGQDHIFSRPFPKFHNLEEMGEDWQAPAEDFTVTMKMDGSLGISYATPQGIQIATRGSFTSDRQYTPRDSFKNATAPCRGKRISTRIFLKSFIQPIASSWTTATSTT